MATVQVTPKLGGGCKAPILISGKFGTEYVACGQCRYCRISRQRKWTARLILESLAWPQNMFLTLTYADEHRLGYLEYSHVQKWLKRLRKRDGRYRFFAAGVHGEVSGREHWHVALFGMRAPVASLGRVAGDVVCWPYGTAHAGLLSKESAAYIAKYTVKEMGSTHKHLMRCSRRPGIGFAGVQALASQLAKHKVDLDKVRALTLGGIRVGIDATVRRWLEAETGDTARWRGRVYLNQESSFVFGSPDLREQTRVDVELLDGRAVSLHALTRKNPL